MSSHAPMVSSVTMAAFVSPSSKIKTPARSGSRTPLTCSHMPHDLDRRRIWRRDVDLRDPSPQIRGDRQTDRL
jgi:hypothetical protein